MQVATAHQETDRRATLKREAVIISGMLVACASLWMASSKK